MGSVGASGNNRGWNKDIIRQNYHNRITSLYRKVLLLPVWSQEGLFLKIPGRTQFSLIAIFNYLLFYFQTDCYPIIIDNSASPALISQIKYLWMTYRAMCGSKVLFLIKKPAGIEELFQRKPAFLIPLPEFRFGWVLLLDVAGRVFPLRWKICTESS